MNAGSLSRGVVGPVRHGLDQLRALVPGLLVCLLATVAAFGLAEVEHDLTGRAWLSPLVLAILLGAGVRSLWTPGPRLEFGIGFCAKTLLELAVVLLGASVSTAILSSLGLGLILGILVIVVLAIGSGFLIGRLLGLNPRVSLLIACGNAICGNSAIAAIAPVIDADPQDVAVSISFTAVLGVIVMLALPLFAALDAMDAREFGVLSGLTVYAVPQVLAAAAALGPTAIQTGTVVKLVRVLMLGPVILGLSLLFRGRATPPGRVGLHRLLPWFIVGFVVLIALRSMNAIPAFALPGMAAASELLTVVAMAALGLQTDLRAVARAGARTVGAVVLSLAALVGLSLILIQTLFP